MTCSQLAALHQYRRGQGFEYRTSLIFFSGFLFATAKVAYSTAMIFIHIIIHSAVHKYDFHIFITSEKSLFTALTIFAVPFKLLKPQFIGRIGRILHTIRWHHLLLRPESFRVFLSCANYGFYHLNLAGITKFKYEKKNEKDSGRSSKMTPSCKWPIRVHVASSLCFKARLSAKTLMWKWFLILKQIKLIFTTKVSQLEPRFESECFWTRKWPIIV